MTALRHLATAALTLLLYPAVLVGVGQSDDMGGEDE